MTKTSWKIEVADDLLDRPPAVELSVTHNGWQYSVVKIPVEDLDRLIDDLKNFKGGE